MKKCLNILAIGLLFLTSCLNELQGDREETTGPSNIVLNIATKPQTKLGAASDGDVMSNLHIWLVYGTTVKGYLCQDDAECKITGSTATAIFENVPRGACTLYLVANLPNNSTLPTSFGVGSTITDDFLKYVLPEVVNHEPPYGASTPGMPLSTSVSLSVGAGTNKVSAELVRTCAKLTITVRNNTTNNTIILKDLILSKRNPNIGYLFEQSDYSIPLAADFGEFRPYAHSAGDDVTDVIPQGRERIYLQQYMYETATKGAANLGFRIVGGLFPNGTTSAKVQDNVVYSRGAEVTARGSLSSAGRCLIQSYSNKYYLYNNNGTLSLSSETVDEILAKSNFDNYLWTFTGTTNNVITNCASGANTIRINSTNVTLYSGTSVSYDGYTRSKGFRFYSGNYYMYANSTIVAASSRSKTNDSRYWKVFQLKEDLVDDNDIQLEGASVYFDKNILSLNYINKYGIPVPLKQIRRNQDVQIVVNIHYNPNSGVLFFETSDWVDDKNETTFD